MPILAEVSTVVYEALGPSNLLCSEESTSYSQNMGALRPHPGEHADEVINELDRDGGLDANHGTQHNSGGLQVLNIITTQIPFLAISVRCALLQHWRFIPSS